MVELGPKLYQFIFTKKEKRGILLLKKPWFFENQFLVIHLWKPELNIGDDSFKRALTWIQIWGLPNHQFSKQVVWKIGKIFVKCLNVIIPKNGSRNGRMMKVLKLIQENHC